MLVKEALEDYRYHITRLTAESQRWYLGKLTTFAEWCDKQNIELERLRPQDVGRFIDSLRTRINPQTKKPLTSHALNGYGRVIRAFLSWASREYEGEVSSRLSQRIVLPKIEEKVIQTLTPDHISALFVATDREFNDELRLRDKAILSVLIDCALRASELITLTIGNVHLAPNDGWLVCMGKGRRQREVPLGAKARNMLHKYIRRYRQNAAPGDVVFVSRFHQPMTVHGLDMIIYRLADWAKITDVRVSAHVFRHTSSVLYLEGGGDVYRLSRKLGHQGVQITENYLKTYHQRQARNDKSVLDSLR